jgi:hypothetical protein
MSFVLPERMSHLRSAILHGMVFRTSEDDNNNFVLCPPVVTEKDSVLFSDWSNFRSWWFRWLNWSSLVTFLYSHIDLSHFFFLEAIAPCKVRAATLDPSLIQFRQTDPLRLIFTCLLRPFFVSYRRVVLIGFQLPTTIPPLPRCSKTKWEFETILYWAWNKWRNEYEHIYKQSIINYRKCKI